MLCDKKWITFVAVDALSTIDKKHYLVNYNSIQIFILL